MNILNTLLALAPIITVFLLLVVFKLSAKISMAIAYVVTALLAVFFWQAAPAVVAAATVNGMIVALTILYSASLDMSRPSANITSPTVAAAAITGSSATSTTMRAAVSMCGSRGHSLVRARAAAGPIPPRQNMATCSISSAREKGSPPFAIRSTRRAASCGRRARRRPRVACGIQVNATRSRSPAKSGRRRSRLSGPKQRPICALGK